VIVAIVADQGNGDGTQGGAELTMREFGQAAPADVTLTQDVGDADTVIIGNCVTLHPDVIPALDGKRVIRYHNDLARHEHPTLRKWLEQNAEHVFTSPMHQRLYGLAGDWPNIPPPVDLARFRPSRVHRRHGKRAGTCAIASWQGPGKGQQMVREWSDRNEPVDVYGAGAFGPRGPNLNSMGPLPYELVPEVLWRYERFVHLPTAPEPFGRAVLEAWAAGCSLVVNRQVGAVHYIENDRDSLETAAADFWDLVANPVTA
jgi:hypothetical protein